MISIVLAVRDALADTKGIAGLLPHITRSPYELIVVDNGSTPDTEVFYRRCIQPQVPAFQYLRNPENRGVLAAWLQGCAAARGELVACLHNDLFLYAPDWNGAVAGWAARLERPGILGFAGYREPAAAGQGAPLVSAWVDAEAHGERLGAAPLPVPVIHASAMILTRPLLGALEGWRPRGDQPYDHELSRASLDRGFRNWVLPVPSAHVGGVTSGRAAPPPGPKPSQPREAAAMLQRDPGEFVPIPPGEPVSVDLGCSGGKRARIGVHREPRPGVDVLCDLGFEPLPFRDNSVDYFVAHDLLEHIPGYVFYREDGRWRRLYPRIELLREIHRCLKPRGRFESYTPCHPFPQWAQDPTHTSPPWVPESWPYYCGAYGGKNGLPGAYGIDFEFKLITTEIRGFLLRAIVEKP